MIGTNYSLILENNSPVLAVELLFDRVYVCSAFVDNTNIIF